MRAGGQSSSSPSHLPNDSGQSQCTHHCWVDKLLMGIWTPRPLDQQTTTDPHCTIGHPKDALVSVHIHVYIYLHVRLSYIIVLYKCRMMLTSFLPFVICPRRSLSWRTSAASSAAERLLTSLTAKRWMALGWTYEQQPQPTTYRTHDWPCTSS